MKSVCKTASAALLSFAALATAPAHAEDGKANDEFTITGYAEGVTDYRWRGISASAGNFAIQGSINVGHSSGFYAGAWASSIADSDTYGNSEVDINAGWSGDIASGLTSDVGLILYAYPNGHVGHANVVEAYTSLSKKFGPVTGKIGVNYAWKQDALGGDDNLYISTNFDYELPGTPVALSAHAGFSDGAWSPNRLTGKSMKGGFDYSLGATYSITKNLSVGATYTGVDGDAQKGYSNDTVVGALTLAF